MASAKDLVGAMCYHLGGDQNVTWIFQVDACSRGVATGKIVDVKANGGDMCVLLNPADIFAFTEHPLALFAITGYYGQDLSLRMNRLLQCTRSWFHTYGPGILDAECWIIELVTRF